jgi:class 3 adenylate cyclase
MKRALLATLWIGALAAGVAIVLEVSGLLARGDAFLARVLNLSPDEPIVFEHHLVVIALSFAVAWTMLLMTDPLRRVAVLCLIIAELIGAAWLLHLVGIFFPPLPAIVAVTVVTLLAFLLGATRSAQRQRAVARLFRGRLAPAAQERLTESETLDLSQPVAREASFLFCEIANEAGLIDELSPAACAQLTREFIDFASRDFLEAGGYLHAADGEGIRVLFGFPGKSDRHAFEAAQAALAFRDHFRAAASGKPDSLGKIDLRLGLSSGMVVATVREDVPGGEIVVAGEPLEVARRLARANQIYGSQILLDPRAFSAGGREILARPMDFLRSVEPHERLEVYELLALGEKASPDEVARRDRFWTAVLYFRERRWNEAFAEFTRARDGRTDEDRPLQWYLRRLEPLCLKMTTEPPPITEPVSPLL